MCLLEAYAQCVCVCECVCVFVCLFVCVCVCVCVCVFVLFDLVLIGKQMKEVGLLGGVYGTNVESELFQL